MALVTNGRGGTHFTQKKDNLHSQHPRFSSSHSLLQLLTLQSSTFSPDQNTLDRRRLINFEAHVAHDDLSITIYTVCLLSTCNTLPVRHPRSCHTYHQCGYLNTLLPQLFLHVSLQTFGQEFQKFEICYCSSAHSDSSSMAVLMFQQQLMCMWLLFDKT